MTRARNLSRLGNLNAITATSGNLIGIGSTTPGNKLTVVGDGNFTGVITATSGLDAIGIQSGGVNIATGIITALNFVGTGNTFAVNGSIVDISISGSAGAGGTDNINTGTAATFTSDVNIADSIIHVGDTNTKIRFPAVDTFTVETSGGERLRITGIGSVGVGINDPTAQFQVNSTKNAETDRHDANNYHLALRNPADDNGEAIGLSFAITSNVTKVGAAILHERDSGGSQGSLQFYTSSDGDSVTERLRIESDGTIIPGADATQDLGATDKRWANIFSADLQLSNEGSANDVDGTWGKYTIQEGEDDLFLINRRNGKKYKFLLQEVN